MKQSFIAASAYLVLGLISGIFYQEFIKAHHFSDATYTQLSTVHTHLLTLGLLFFMGVIALDKLFALSSSGLFQLFFWIYNVGLVVSVAMMIWHGCLTVLAAPVPPSVAGIAGLGHMIMAVGLALFMTLLGSAIFSKKTAAND